MIVAKDHSSDLRASSTVYPVAPFSRGNIMPFLPPLLASQLVFLRTVFCQIQFTTLRTFTV